MITLSRMIIWIFQFLFLYYIFYMILVHLEGENKQKGKKKSKIEDVTIVIPAHNEEKSIGEVLKSVFSLDYPRKKLKVIVIDDGSTDKTYEIAKKFPVKIIRNAKRIGKARSLNRALKEVETPFFVTLDADTIVEKRSLKELFFAFYEQDDGKLAAVTSRIGVWNPKNLLEKIQKLEYDIMAYLTYLLWKIDAQYVIPGPFSLYKTEAVRKVGGFDPSSIAEDQEIAYRLRKAGYRIGFAKDSFVKTEVPSNIRGWYKQRKRWAAGTIQTILKHIDTMSPAYGEFGMQVIRNFFLYLMTFATLLALYLYFLDPLYDYLRNLYEIHFDILPYIKNFSLNFSINLFDLDPQTLIYLFTDFSLLLLVYVFFRFSRDRDELLKYFVYGFIYPLGLVVVSLLATIELGIKRVIEW